MNNAILIYCRPGFENDAANELKLQANSFNIDGYIKAKANSAYLLFYPHNPQDIFSLWQNLGIRNLIFARQLLLCFDFLENLPENDRISPIIKACQDSLSKLQNDENMNIIFKDIFVEVPDTNEHKELLTFCKKFSTPLKIKLEKNKILPPHTTKSELSDDKKSAEQDNLHCLFLDNKTCYLAMSDSKKSSPHFMGIPRLKFPHDAPSRSTLKLEEAFLSFLKEEQRKLLLTSGMQAIDLGASPGGWTYQFVQRNILVTAIDNANMDKKLLASGLVTHIKEDGFKYIPKKPVQWMVCDMVEKPSRIITLILKWAKNKYAQNFIFNLKLPMKKRAEEVYSCLDLLKKELDNSNFNYLLECKQLYHDREEVTVWLKIN